MFGSAGTVFRRVNTLSATDLVYSGGWWGVLSLIPEKRYFYPLGCSFHQRETRLLFFWESFLKTFR